jgi:hypothetical protein
MSVCQITFVFGDQTERIASVVFDKSVKEPFAELQRAAAKNLDLSVDVDLARVHFQYEDDDGDYVTMADDADALEAFAVHEDAGQDDILLIVKLHPAPQVPHVVVSAPKKVAADDEWFSEGDTKDDDIPVSGEGLKAILDENFVLEFCAFLKDPAVRQVLPEVSANIAAAVLKKASGRDLYDIVASNAVLKQTTLLSREWPFLKQVTPAYEQWVSGLTEDQLGKVAFQIPIVLARLVAKRERLHKAIFVKNKSLSKVLKITQFDFGSVDFATVMENVANSHVDQAGHVAGGVCAVCQNPIEGARYQCMVCVGFDMCEACESKGSHPTEHAMMKFRSSAAGYVGLAHASAVYGKKALKHQLKAMKHEAKLAKKEAKHAKKAAKHGDDYEKVKKHGKHAMPPAYVPSLSFAAVAGGVPVTDKTPAKTATQSDDASHKRQY